MIKFERNMELDIAMKSIVQSMVDVNEYIANTLNYMERILTPKQEKELIKILKKYSIPNEGLKYDLKALTNNSYYRDIKFDNIHYKTVKFERTTIKKRTLMNMNFH